MTVPFSARSHVFSGFRSFPTAICCKQQTIHNSTKMQIVGGDPSSSATIQRGRRQRRRRGRYASPVMILASFCKNHRAPCNGPSVERNYRFDRYIVAPLLSLRVLLRFRFDFCHNRFRSIHNDLIQFPLHRIEVKNASQKLHYVIIGQNVWCFKE